MSCRYRQHLSAVRSSVARAKLRRIRYHARRMIRSVELPRVSLRARRAGIAKSEIHPRPIPPVRPRRTILQAIGEFCTGIMFGSRAGEPSGRHRS